MIGSGKSASERLAEVTYQNIVDETVARAGEQVDEDGQVHKSAQDKKGKAAGKQAAAQKSVQAGGTDTMAGTAPATLATAGTGSSHAAVDSNSPSNLSHPSSFAANDVAAMPDAEHVVKASLPETTLTDVSGLAEDAGASIGLRRLSDAIGVLLAQPPASDAELSSAIDDFVDGMQTLGQADTAEGALRNVLAATAGDVDELQHRYDLAQNSGVALGAVPADFVAGKKTASLALAAQNAATDSADVTAAKDALLQQLTAGVTDPTKLAGEVAGLQQALATDGRGDEIGSQLGLLLQDANVSSGGASGVYAAAAMLGIPLEADGMAAASDKAQNVKTDGAVRRAEVKAAQDKAEAARTAAAQASQSRGNYNGGGSAGFGGASGTPASAITGAAALGDISGLKMKSNAKIGDFRLGVLPDYDNGSTGGASGFINRTGVVPPIIGGYVDVKNGGVDTAAADRWINDAVKNGIPAVSFSFSAWETGKLSDAQLSAIKSSVQKAQAAGLQVDVRYGYEMNYGGGGADQGGRVNNNNRPEAFKTQFTQVANALQQERAATPPAMMVWSPNVISGGVLPYADWLPDDINTVDMIGLDWYQNANSEMSAQSIAQVMEPIKAISDKTGLPFMFGETGVTGSSNPGTKTMDLLKIITGDEFRNMMGDKFVGGFVFDYVKDGNNYGLSQNSATAGQVKDLYSSIEK